MNYLRILYSLYPASKVLSEYRYAIKLAKKYRCKRVLDVGCGKGNLGRILLEETELETYIGVDVEDIARTTEPNLLFIVADGRQPLLRCCFDCVFFVNSLFYIGYNSLFNYVRLSKYIIIIDIDPTYPHVWVADRLESGFKGFRMRKKHLINELSKAGFQIVEAGGFSTYYVVVKNEHDDHLSGIKT